MRVPALLVSAFFIVVLAACGSSSREDEPQVLPNSLADTSLHVAQREIPRYGPQSAADSSRNVKVHGQVLYVPVYSHIFYRTRENEFDLTATLSIRNISPSEAIRIHEVDYFDSEGTLLRSYLDHPRRIGPLASTYVVIDEDDRSGGVGANFIVEWDADRLMAPPLVEAVMISAANTQGLSFTSPARVLQEW